ncbi:unnamed protein product [Moneuplotes crassus]|uniref:Uncharacterized protein n=1 Tax=Euplotes crassus TaxID=5936 RepID=A0AAD1X6G5_EUPCR|nr:unnamed protein product [Moneuplotes crassus]
MAAPEEPDFLDCVYNECDNARKYFCLNHNKRVCADCACALHYGCNLQTIGCHDELWKATGLLQKLLQTLTDKAKEFDMKDQIEGLDGCLKHFSDTFNTFEQEVRYALKKKNQYLKITPLIEKARVIKNAILTGDFGKHGKFEGDSNPVLRLLYDSTLISLTYSKIGEQKKQDIKKSPEFLQVLREVTTAQREHIESKAARELEKKKEEVEKQTEAKYREQMKQQKEAGDRIILDLSAKIEDQDRQIFTEKELKEDFEQQLSILKLQHQQLQTQHDDLQLKYNQNDQQLKQKEGVLKIHLQRHFRRNKDFNSNTNLELSFDNTKHKDLIDSLSDSQVKLPDIKRIKIDNIKNSHLKSIDKFLEKSFPDSLQLLCLNRNALELLEGAKIMEGVTHSLPNVTKEIYLRRLEFQSSEVETIFRHSTQTQRLIFRLCKIHTKQNMNFVPGKTNITYLSFDSCGCSSVCMEWDTHPERFEYIVEAISKSSLKDTLKTLNINICKISSAKVEEMMTTHGMTKVKVVEEYNNPLND